ncbi:MAG: MBL fold metallo-hydrolase [Lachnospiraceae bacterium]|nr:MBL fold metallo-hydrolase [Lachnospiraceae bacterium]
MEKDIYFMALGGGQRVGASCYYLKLGGSNLILDAGTGISDGIVFEPELYSLITSPFIQSMNQIDQIYISHAHLDHLGYLLKIMRDAGKAGVYMTEITALLAEYQLYDRDFVYRGKGEEKRLAAKNLLDRIARVSYMKQIDFGKYKVTFLPAGHIPGAMMLLFEFGKRRILYTGDYSLERTALTNGCVVPADIPIDTVIMCGLHAKHPDYVKKGDALFGRVQDALRIVEETGVSVLCRIQQLSKGIEFIKTLSEWNVNKIPIFLDRQVMDVVLKMEQMSIPIMDMEHRGVGQIPPKLPHILITNRRKGFFGRFYKEVNIEFSLHGDFSDMQEFIRKVNPKKAVIVHCAKEHSSLDQTIEQVMMKDGECRTQFIFAEEKEIYQL